MKRVEKPDELASRPSICLITALTVADFIDRDLIIDAHANTGAQLGILTLASLLRQDGLYPAVLNLDDLFYEFIEQDGKRSLLTDRIAALSEEGKAYDGTLPSFFFPFVAAHLRSQSFNIFGLSSICSSYPLTLRLAQEIRRTNPDAVIILGGPQASVVDIATMCAFPCIDVIVRGEADDSFPELLRLLEKNDSRWQSLPGLTFRRGDDVVRNLNAPVVEGLDRLPLPAFDLDSRIRKRGGIHLEAGRGCPFTCSFCSTNDFFRRNFRLKSASAMIEEISALKKEYGLNYFSLVHDMYTVDRKKVVEFCEAAIASGVQFTWGCSARTDCIDDDLLALMAKAGCSGIFFGIETGSQRLQKVVNKNLNLNEAVKRIECASRNGIRTTVALIVGFPEESREDLRDTIHFFINSLRFENAEPQCSLLAPLAATPVYEQHKDRLIFDHIFSDISNQSWRQDPVEEEMIRAHPSVFPNFYAIPTAIDRGYIKEVTDFATYLATWFRWLPVAILQDSRDLLSVFDRWREWRLERKPRTDDEDTSWTPYYSHRRFHKEFIEFVQGCYLLEMSVASEAIEAAVQAECLTAHNEVTPIADSVDILEDSVVPYRLPHMSLVEFDVDYGELILALRNNTDLTRVTVRKTTVVFSSADERFDVWQLPPLSAALLDLCDGRRTVRDITLAFSALGTELSEIPAETVCFYGLTQLKADGAIGLSASPVIWQAPQDLAKKTEEAHYAFPRQAGNTQQPWPPDGRERKTAMA